MPVSRSSPTKLALADVEFQRSPGSWLHIVVTRQAALILAGSCIFGSLLHTAALVCLFAITMHIAPIFNFNGRMLAWRNVP